MGNEAVYKIVKQAFDKIDKSKDINLLAVMSDTAVDAYCEAWCAAKERIIDILLVAGVRDPNILGKINNLGVDK